MSATAKDGDWIAVQVQCGYEKAVGERLRDRRYEEFVPLSVEHVTRRGREERRERGLFPGYVFCRYIQCPAHRIVQVPAVIRIVGSAAGPLSIPDDEIENIRLVIDSGLYSEPWKFLEPGQQVIVTRGALKGIRGILISSKKGMRLVINVSILGRGVAIEMNAVDVMQAVNIPPVAIEYPRSEFL